MSDESVQQPAVEQAQPEAQTYKVSRGLLERLVAALISRPYSEVFDVVRQLELETGERIVRTQDAPAQETVKSSEPTQAA